MVKSEMSVRTTRRTFLAATTLASAAAAILALGALVSGQSPSGAASAPPPDLLDHLDIRGAAKVMDALAIEMRDGVRLFGTVILPAGDRAPSRMPAILMKTPYRFEPELSRPLRAVVASALVRKGYAIVLVNDRGMQWSEGHYRWLIGANADGYDTLSWIAAQPWSNGRVGTFGCSSSAETQLGLASTNHPAHRAMVAMSPATGASNIEGFRDHGIFYKGGIPSLDWAWWYASHAPVVRPYLPRDLTPDERARTARAFASQVIPRAPESLAQHQLPSQDILSASGFPPTEWNRLIQLTPGSPEWKAYDFFREGDTTRVPGLHVSSWYDLEAYGTLRLFEYIAGHAPHQHLVMGGGPHCSMGRETADTTVGDRTVGDARFDWATLIVRFFDHWLLEGAATPFDAPRVQYYSLNTSQWSTATTWPIPSVRPLRFYLESGGHANSAKGDGVLSEKMIKEASADTLRYDPMDPAPALGGGCCSGRASQEQTPMEARDDVLVYTSAPLERPLDVTGYVNVTLAVSSSAPDTDIIVRLVDVHPDGKAYNVADTGLRMRYRKGYERPEPMTPGTVYPVTIPGMATASRFGAGHRIRLQVTSSGFPQYERNLNTGGDNFNESRAQVARNTIHHGAVHTSFIELPVDSKP